jgi:hypothetical protein
MRMLQNYQSCIAESETPSSKLRSAVWECQTNHTLTLQAEKEASLSWSIQVQLDGIFRPTRLLVITRVHAIPAESARQEVVDNRTLLCVKPT